jgi:hypothetical protein
MAHSVGRTLSSLSPSGSPFLTSSQGLLTPTLHSSFLSPTSFSQPALTTPGLWSLSLSPSAFGRTLLSPSTHSSEPNPFETSFKRDRSSMTAEDAVGLHYLFSQRDKTSGLGVGVGKDTFFGSMNLGGGDGRKRSISMGMGAGDEDRWTGEYWGGMGGWKRARVEEEEYDTSGNGSVAPSFGGSGIEMGYQHHLAQQGSEGPSPQTTTSELPTPTSTHLSLPLYTDLAYSKPTYPLPGRLPSFLADEIHYPSAVVLPPVLAPPRTYEPFAFPSHYVPSSHSSPASSHSSIPTPKAEPASTKKTTPSKTMRGKGKKSNPLDATVDGGEEGEEEAKRKLFLERNRVAAIKSRQKKREKVGNLEKSTSPPSLPSIPTNAILTAAKDLANTNAELQATALSLLSELQSLRQSLTPLHPPTSCTCPLINTYISREELGGGIPLLQSIASDVLARDYAKIPRLGGGDDDCYGPNGRLPALPIVTSEEKEEKQAGEEKEEYNPLPPLATSPKSISTTPPPSPPREATRLAFGGNEEKSRKRMFPDVGGERSFTRSAAVVVAGGAGGKRGLRSGK